MKKMKLVLAMVLLLATLSSFCACFGGFEVNRALVHDFNVSASYSQYYYTYYLVHYTNIETEDTNFDLDKYKDGVYKFVTGLPEEGEKEVYISEKKVIAKVKIIKKYPIIVEDQGENYEIVTYGKSLYDSEGFDVEKMKEKMNERKTTIYVAKENVILYVD